jgi:hypothetical protein
MAAIKWSTLVTVRRRIWRCVSSPKKRSIKLSEEDLVGVKRKCTLGFFASHSFMAGALWTEDVV